jgi:hypothetical protein
VRIYIGGNSPVVCLVKSEDILLTGSASPGFKPLLVGGLLMLLKWCFLQATTYLNAITQEMTSIITERDEAIEVKGLSPSQDQGQTWAIPN